MSGEPASENYLRPRTSFPVCVALVVQESEDCYLAGFEQRSGKQKWCVRINEGKADRMRIRVNEPAPDPAFLLAHDGRAVAVSNYGTVSAVDPADGKVVWSIAYDRLPELKATRAWRLGGRVIRTRLGLGSAIIVDGDLLVVPADSDELLRIDPKTGKVLSRMASKIPYAGDRQLAIRSFLGIVDDKLFFTGSLEPQLSGAFGVIGKQSPSHDQFRGGDLLYGLPGPYTAQPCLGRDRAYLPIDDSICGYSMERNRIISRHHAESKPCGKLVLSDGYLVIPTDAGVDVYIE